MTRYYSILFCLIGLLVLPSCAQTPPEVNPDNKRVLVFTKTNGYRHGSISDGVAMIKSLGDKHGFSVTQDESSDPFDHLDSLVQFGAIIFCNTSGNNLLNASQQANFEAYIQQGGGFVGIHAATDTYRDRSWPWYNDLVGAIVQTNPNHTSNDHVNTMEVSNKRHPSVAHLNDAWEKREEYYYWDKNGGWLYDQNEILLTVRETTGSNGQVNDYDRSREVAWYKEFDGGRSFYTALGHHGSDFRADDDFIAHLEGGILWAAGWD